MLEVIIKHSILALLAVAFTSPAHAVVINGNTSCKVLIDSILQNSQGVRDINQIETLTIINYNEENVRALPPGQRPPPFHHHMDGEVEFKNPALLAKEKALADKWGADFMALEEIHDGTSLMTVSPNGDVPVFTNGNDADRHIAFEVKKDLPFYIDVESHADVTWNDPDEHQVGKVFARDLPALLVKTTPIRDPFLIVIGNHAKSQRDRPNDPNSKDMATAEYKSARDIIVQYQQKYPNAIIVMPGDYNRNIPTAPEVKPIFDVMVSPFDVKNIPAGSDSRVTQIFFPKDGPMVRSQLDDILVSKNAIDSVVSMEVIPNTDDAGNPIPLPKTFQERQRNPSDHLAVKLVINVKKLIALAQGHN